MIFLVILWSLYHIHALPVNHETPELENSVLSRYKRNAVSHFPVELRNCIARKLKNRLLDLLSGEDESKLKDLYAAADECILEYSKTHDLQNELTERGWYNAKETTFNQPIIFPGTKWCGMGNMANHPDDLGTLNEPDSCCRKHDNCPDHIPPFKEKYGLKNNSPATLSHCDCDQEFSGCLKNVSSQQKLPSQLIGKLFFNTFKISCFKMDYPITGCAKYHETGIKKSCILYEQDKTQPMKWQIFDSSLF